MLSRANVIAVFTLKCCKESEENRVSNWKNGSWFSFFSSKCSVPVPL